MEFCVLFGGASFEHEISIVSAIALKGVLKDRIKYFIFLDENHHF
ncbi:D-alanine--D-alanine ligase, partial [Helicobacter pylori]